MILKIALCAVICLAMAGTYFAGFDRAVSVRGDWMVMRDAGKCIVYDPDYRVSYKWATRADGRCHLSDAAWHYLIPWN
jgi:hypothetical protein